MVLDKLVTIMLSLSLSSTPIVGTSSVKKGIYEPKSQGVIQERVENNTNLESSLQETNLKEFYAVEVVHPGTNGVINENYALGKTGSGDKEAAEIPPHGKIILRMEKPFSPLQFHNEGRIVVNKDANFSVAAWIRTEYDEKQGVKYAWRWLALTLVPGGLDIPKCDQTIVDTIMITNNGEEPMQVYGAIGYELIMNNK